MAKPRASGSGSQANVSRNSGRHGHGSATSTSTSSTLIALACICGLGLASAQTTAGNRANTWAVTGNSGVSCQQMFRGQGGKVYILDKVERNPISINGHPAWATEYDTSTNTYRTMDVATNTFCAGGNVLPNGTWAVFGGNKAVTYGGLDGVNGAMPYDNYNGGTAIRLLTPCTDKSCQWTTPSYAYMQSERWYPSIETLQDGSMAILGGMRDGGYVNTEYADNPTIEYFPSKGNQLGLNILAETLPCNLYPLTWLLPSGNLFVQSNLGAEIFDWQNSVEHPLPDIPHAVRVYPASGASAMLPLTPANNWTATLLFCGGTNLQPDQWMTSPNWNVAAYPADYTCVSITPDKSSQWTDEDSMFEGRSMGQFIILPDGRLFHLNGIATGTAGYGNVSWAIGQSYGDNPLLTAAYYDPSAPKGKRWIRPSNLQKMTVNRMYHSSATLLADGSIMDCGSNPNADYIPKSGFKDERGVTYKYPTEYRVEMFYPDYMDRRKPQPSGIPTTLTYGGNYFDITLSAADLFNNVSNVDTVKVNVMRTGYSTHAMNMGMRLVQLNTTWTLNSDGSAVIHTSQMPPNPSIMAPGPALVYVVVAGTPSTGVDIMVGNGKIGTQPTSKVQAMPGTISGSGAVIKSADGSAGSNGLGSDVAAGATSNTITKSAAFKSSTLSQIGVMLATLSTLAVSVAFLS